MRQLKRSDNKKTDLLACSNRTEQHSDYETDEEREQIAPVGRQRVEAAQARSKGGSRR